MPEYIEREATNADFEKCNAENPKWTPNRVKALIARQTAAEVDPVRHGRWIDGMPYVNSRWRVCSVFHRSAHDPAGGDAYCSYCGARMDGDG